MGRKRKNPIPVANRSEFMRDLAAVTTISEASKLWGVSTYRLNRYCNEGKLVSTKPDGEGIWLISVRHLTALFGPPSLPSDNAKIFVD